MKNSFLSFFLISEIAFKNYCFLLLYFLILMS